VTYGAKNSHHHHTCTTECDAPNILQPDFLNRPLADVFFPIKPTERKFYTNKTHTSKKTFIIHQPSPLPCYRMYSSTSSIKSSYGWVLEATSYSLSTPYERGSFTGTYKKNSDT
jgi:hypothetical protein